ncbi:MAG TPA: hypothetical protein VGC77_12355 [Rhodopseudomonas sp.]|uniref:hypothetical protein n=1 Tax=Rhodopseudomonas sp. TaxID=1078 RepID=UPI002ED99015
MRPGFLKIRCAWLRGIGLLSVFCLVAANAHAQSPEKLSQRERTFLDLIEVGDEAKAVEYAKVAEINPNSIAGEPLGSWFYAMFPNRGGTPIQRRLNVQRIVFQTFKQNPNPPSIQKNAIARFCNYAPYNDNPMMKFGNADEQRMLATQRFNQQKPHIDNMAAAFDSLIGYGLRDKTIINEIFISCFFHNAASLSDGVVNENEYVYDTLITKILKAGADINTEDGPERPIQFALRLGYPGIVERLLRDGAQLNFVVRTNAFDHTNPSEGCQPRRSRSVYGAMFNYVDSRNVEAALRVVSALAKAGYSPTTKYGYTENPNGQILCHYKSFYDAVVDSGNLPYAARIKEIADGMGTPPAPPVDSPKPAATSTPAQPVQAALTAPPPIGAWRFTVENGRPVALAKSEKPDGSHLAALRLECAAGGRLEYVAVAARNGFDTLWVNGIDDTLHTIPLVKGRVTGADNVLLSKEFLTMEGIAKRDNRPGWGMEMSIDGPEAGMQTIEMGGFSKVRSFMLSQCKS